MKYKIETDRQRQTAVTEDRDKQTETDRQTDRDRQTPDRQRQTERDRQTRALSYSF